MGLGWFVVKRVEGAVGKAEENEELIKMADIDFTKGAEKVFL